MGQIKAIPTEYNGYLFRSRLEARWAVFFDALGVEYQYEAEGYKGLDNVYYLPDFYLPEEDVHVEVKPTDEKLREDWEKILAAIDWDATPVSNGLLILGEIPNPNDVGPGSVPMFSFLYCHKGVIAGKAAFFHKWYGKRLSVGSKNIVKELVALSAFNDIVGDYYCDTEMPSEVSTRYVLAKQEDLWSCDNDRLRDAYRKARQARFEHGETPTKESVQIRW